MPWYSIRLDAARSPEHPAGSAEICYLLQLPLDPTGLIDRTEHRARPADARVLRSLPDAPEAAGYVVERGDGWAFSYEPGTADDEVLLHPEVHPFCVGDYCSITGEDEAQHSFRVTACRPLAV